MGILRIRQGFFDKMVSKKEFLTMPGSDESMTNYFEELDQDKNGFLGTVGKI